MVALLQRRLPRLLVSAATVLTVACGGESPVGEGTLEIGTGESQFEGLTDGQEVELIYGAQGGYHVWLSLRAEGIEPQRTQMRIETQRADESMAPQVSEVRVDLRQAGADTGDPQSAFSEMIGWPAVLSQPGCFVDRLLRIEVTLQDKQGRIARDERFVTPKAPAATPPSPCAP